MTKKQELVKARKQNERLLKMVTEEREKIAGYEQLAKVHSAYIAILLKKLDATKNNAVCINADEVAEALKNYETRALACDDGSWSLYFEDAEKK